MISGVQLAETKLGESKSILAAITLSFFSVVAIADPCMDADLSPLGYGTELTPDEMYLEQHGCCTAKSTLWNELNRDLQSHEKEKPSLSSVFSA